MEFKRTTVNYGFWIAKTLIIAALLIAILFNAFNVTRKMIMEDFTDFLEFELLSASVGDWILGYLFSFFVAYLLHFLAYSFAKSSKPNKKVKNTQLHKHFWRTTIFWFIVDKEGSNQKPALMNQLTGIMLKLFSPDYSSANTFKAILSSGLLNKETSTISSSQHTDEENNSTPLGSESEKNDVNDYGVHLRKNRRKDFIIYSNWLNVISACVIAFIALYQLQGIFLVFLGFHMLSRIIEVVFAFYKDVVQAKMNKKDGTIGYKSSNLKRGNRISLAVHSYVEFVILFACVYYLFDNHLNSKFNDMGTNSFIDFLVYSMSVSAYNFSLDVEATTSGMLVHVSQVFVSITLVVLSIASYLGLEDKMSEYEKKEMENGEYI